MGMGIGEESPFVSLSTTEHTERPTAVTEHTEGIGVREVLEFSAFRVPRSGFSVFSGKSVTGSV